MPGISTSGRMSRTDAAAPASPGQGPARLIRPSSPTSSEAVGHVEQAATGQGREEAGAKPERRLARGRCHRRRCFMPEQGTLGFYR